MYAVHLALLFNADTYEKVCYTLYTEENLMAVS